MMPEFIKKVAHELNLYLSESIRSLRSSTTNVEEFVNQMKSLKKIDKKLPKLKDKISFVGAIITVL
jgi:macrodomain Ter protein organizer (MatP/YcbG family)